jgi:broad specificity phosphatase PhoE
MERLLLSRHAESLYNTRGLINADPTKTTSPLTEQGCEQARALGLSLADTPLNLCVTSGALRAVETAEIALAGRNVPCVKLSLLNDPPAGTFEDGPVAAFAEWMRENANAIVPGTNASVAASAQRFFDAARFLLAREEEVVLVVAHAPVLRWLHQVATGTQGRLDYQTPLFEFARPFEVSVDALTAGVHDVAHDPAVVFLADTPRSHRGVLKHRT